MGYTILYNFKIKYYKHYYPCGDVKETYQGFQEIRKSFLENLELFLLMDRK